MFGQTLHRDYYPLSLIQVGLHYVLVELPVALTGRRDMPTGKFLKLCSAKTKSKKRSRAESSFKRAIKMPKQLCKNVFCDFLFKSSLVLKLYYQVNTIYIMSDYNFDGLF